MLITKLFRNESATIWFLMLIGALVLTTSLSAQTNVTTVEFPNNSAGERGRILMKMVDSDNDAELKTFLEKQMVPNNETSPEERFELFQRIREDLRGSKLRKVLGFTDRSISLAIEKPNGMLLKIILEFQPADNRISEFGIEMMSPEDLESKSEPPQSIAEIELMPTVEEYLASLAQKDQFSGVVMIAKNGRSIFEKAYGDAEKEFQVKNKVNTKFNIGSINKVFTTLAIGLLADEGKLSFDDTIEKHLPAYPNKDAAKKVTIYQLMTMTSGIGDFFNEEFEALPKDRIRSIDDYLPLFSSKPLEFEPGKGQRYSNGGFVVLGAIIEKASGKDYYDFVRERIFIPIGMEDTDSYELDVVVNNRANGYTYSGNWTETEGVRKNNFYSMPARGSSAGGGYSTAKDFLKFANAIGSGTFPVPKSLKDSKGILTADMLLSGLRIGGGSDGVSAVILSKLPKNYTVIVLSNYDPPSAETIGRKISDWIGK